MDEITAFMLSLILIFLLICFLLIFLTYSILFIQSKSKILEFINLLDFIIFNLFSLSFIIIYDIISCILVTGFTFYLNYIINLLYIIFNFLFAILIYEKVPLKTFTHKFLKKLTNSKRIMIPLVLIITCIVGFYTIYQISEYYSLNPTTPLFTKCLITILDITRNFSFLFGYLILYLWIKIKKTKNYNLKKFTTIITGIIIWAMLIISIMLFCSSVIYYYYVD